MIELAGSKIERNIHFLGRLSNQDAIKLIESLDILCLPTYGEAFPISILEAMSRGKMVITCPKGAIPDMLALPNGSLCGLLVPDKTVHELADAIKWCQSHPSEALEIRKKAYEKVKTCYRKEVVYDIYRQNYRKLL
jgi:glycosyltransferase involved in cell wall biosynthesis